MTQLHNGLGFGAALPPPIPKILLNNDVPVSIAENSAIGTVVGTLTVADIGVGGTYTLLDSGGGTFSLASDQLLVNGAINFETTPSINVDIGYDSPGGATISKIFTITVTNVNEAPVITSSNTYTIAENTTFVANLTATDPENNALTWSLHGVVLDNTKFTITSAGVLSFITAPDFENPQSSFGTNTYRASVDVTDGTNVINQTIIVTVTDVIDTAPTITSASTIGVPENSPLNYSLTADRSGTWSIVGGTDQAKFEIFSGNVLRFLGNVTKNYEIPDDANADTFYQVTVRIDDTYGYFATLAMTVGLQNVDEAATVISWAGSHAIAENSALGTVIAGALSTNDPDAGASGTWSLTDSAGGRFAISGNNIVVNSLLDYEAATSWNITVQYDDGVFAPITQTYAITINDVADDVYSSTNTWPTTGTLVTQGGIAASPPATAVGAHNGSKLFGMANGSGTAIAFYDVGTLSAGTLLGLKYTPDFTNLAQQGKNSMVGIGFRSSNDFHLVGMHGDGVTTGVNKYQFYGPNFNTPDVGNTRVPGGAAQHGSNSGQQFIAILCLSSGLYNFYSGNPADSFPVCSYSNTGGTGNRSGIITMSMIAGTMGVGTVANLVNGASALNSTDSCKFTDGQSNVVMQADFGTPQVINGFNLTQDVTVSHGTWKIAGSNDGTTFTDINGFTLGGETVNTYSFTNMKGYRYYRLIQTSGTTSGSAWLKELEFNIAAGNGMDLEFSFQTPSPISNVPAAAGFGLFVENESTDYGPYMISVDLWKQINPITDITLSNSTITAATSTVGTLAIINGVPPATYQVL